MSAIISVIFFVIGAVLGYQAFILNESKLYFYQFFSPEIFVAACDLGWADPGKLAGELYDFSMAKVSTFDCKGLESVKEFGGVGLFTKLHWYSSLAVKALFSSPVLDYGQLWLLPTLFVGLYASGCFLLLRLFLTTALSVLGALLLTGSPMLASMIHLFRDFSKAPFVIWSLVLLVLLLRSRSYCSSLVIAGLVGSVIGVGVGFRSDVGVLVPIGLLSLLTFVDPKVLKIRISAATILYLAFSISTMPLKLPNDIGGGWGSVVQQGMSRPFKEKLKLEPTIYEVGWEYSDELSLSSIAATERPLRPNWDRDERQPREGFTQALRYSGEHFIKWGKYFAGDLLTQSLKSSFWIVSMPSLFPESKEIRVGILSKVSNWLLKCYKKLNSQVLAIVSALGLLGMLALRYEQNSSEALGLSVLFGGVLAAPALQFSLRHSFHLEFFWVLGSLSIVIALTRIKEVLGAIYRLRLLIVLGSVVVGGGYLVALNYQKYSLRILFTDLLELSRIQLSSSKAIVDSEAISVAVDVPKEHEDIVAAQADSMTSDIARFGNQWDVRAEADRILASVRGCPEGGYRLTIYYETLDNVWQPFDSEIAFEIPKISEANEKEEFKILFPAFYRPTQYFSSVSVSPAPAGCNLSLERLVGTSPFPYLMTAIFSPNWRNERLTNGLGSFDRGG